MVDWLIDYNSMSIHLVYIFGLVVVEMRILHIHIYIFCAVS